MAFENMTYESIMTRMINRVTNKYPNIDTREGSMVYNALAAAGAELAAMYVELENVLKETFVGTASREYILRGCEQMGIDTSIFDASYGVHQAEFDIEVPIGSRWNCDLYNFVVTEFIGADTTTNYYTYKMRCETAGGAPNGTIGTLTPIDYLPTNMAHAELTQCIIYGEDEADDEVIRSKYFDIVNKVTTDGNIAQYEAWCNDYDGIGTCKIVPLANGANTVTVSILDGNNRAASTELINEFQKYIDPDASGMGDGVAPIGAHVTVNTATEKTIDVAATITLKAGYTNTDIIGETLVYLFSDMAYKRSTVPYMAVGAAILDVEGVDSISNLTVNDGTSDISLGTYEIPVLGTATWTTQWVVNS